MASAGTIPLLSSADTGNSQFSIRYDTRKNLRIGCISQASNLVVVPILYGMRYEVRRWRETEGGSLRFRRFNELGRGDEYARNAA